MLVLDCKKEAKIQPSVDSGVHSLLLLVEETCKYFRDNTGTFSLGTCFLSPDLYDAYLYRYYPENLIIQHLSPLSSLCRGTTVLLVVVLYGPHLLKLQFEIVLQK